MKILGIDTSSLAASCALWETGGGGRLEGEFFTNAGLTHSQTIAPMVAALLEQARCQLPEVDAFAVSAGPGSFTGLRIGISTTKGMAFTLDKPCVPISTLASLAENLRQTPGILVPVMDARVGQVYTALFENSGGKIRRLEADAAIPLAELARLLERWEDRSPITLVGDGAAMGREKLTSLGIRTPALAPPALLHQRASSVCRLAAEIPPEHWLTPQDLAPSYLRLAQAERERLQRLQQEQQSK